MEKTKVVVDLDGGTAGVGRPCFTKEYEFPFLAKDIPQVMLVKNILEFEVGGIKIRGQIKGVVFNTQRNSWRIVVRYFGDKAEAALAESSDWKMTRTTNKLPDGPCGIS